jgi:hypothetical protein
MLELNFSRSNRSTTLREAIVSVSMVEMNLEQVMTAREITRGSLHLRLKCIHIVKAIIELERWETRRRRQHRIRIPLDDSWSGTRVKSKFSATYLFAKDPADLTLEHGREPFIRYVLHRENLHDPFTSFLFVMSFIFSKLRLPHIRKGVELWSSATATNAVESRQNERWYLGTRLMAEIRGVWRRCSSCEKGDMKVDIWLGRNQRGEISWHGDMRSVVRRSDDHRAIIATFILGDNCPDVLRVPLNANHLVQH